MTNVNPENSTDKVSDETRAGSAAGASASRAAKRPAGGGAHAKKGGLPLRGLAMVLIAVAVMLGLWALYSMTSGDDDSTVASESKQENSTGSTIGAAPEGSAGPDAAGSRAPGASEDASAPAPAPAPAPGEGDSAASGAADERAAAERGAAAGEENAHSAARDRNDIKVSVLNNSGEVDKAKKEADSLKGGGFKVGYVGNLPGDVLTVPKTTVFFPEGDASAEALAKEVAARYQADIAPMNRDLPKEATDDGAVVVALAVPQA
ncbi:LytR C-terminal domain-containing protein [Corynebacterium sp. MSK105]|uniref:LytR C-terminal domain-containing protein n=1 Tax=unclassified Corynebacterium TaxID=2624378 RepID=UPI00254F37FB|nr:MULTISPECIES: LytR C-terminal domain-containing protein [unclassified Corynebacterium]MDK8482804.1 LytR C-terminal domain-containing protein [Corynebacterium sp. MSK074]MDK8690240.1 LytR C-terminal domain-containing protein [Corynebacterium sp. MSK105]